ncbi:alpha/beta fold hydrolase [Microbacterium sp. P01]|uniref:alpha/beta fold hydrolase n=1 Tax=unclassified Microbacterium TaxID=2609290 RepID=UPI00366B4FA9
MPTLEVRGAVLDYDIAGETGPLVVQLHGLTSSRDRDAQLGLDLSRALRGHRVLRYDARGHGNSTGTRDAADYRWDRLAGDLLALLEHVAPDERVHGVGPSMGTGTLLHAAVRRPKRFASLTFVTPPTAWKTRRAQAARYLDNARLVERLGLSAFVEQGSTAPVPPALAYAPETRPRVDEALLPTVMRGAASTDLPPRKQIARIQAPTLILAWTRDQAHPMKTANRLHETIDSSRLVVARSPYGIMAWPGLFAEHVTTTR